MKTCPRCDGPATEDALRQFGGVCEKCLLDFAAERDAPSFPNLEITRTLGEGGMGVVYEAVQKPLGRKVALKVLSPELAGDPSFVERFTREARALASLSHANIVGIHDFGVHDGVPYLVMEHVEGTSLRKLLAAGKLTAARALDVIPQICDALAYAHSKGVVHRDIKPENVLLTAGGQVKIADFGLAKLAEPDQTRITRTQAVLGTPHYMAPEQVENPNAVDHRADIYSLGVVFYEMLTGELPLGRFKAPSQKSGGDARLDPVVLKSLEKEPDDRWQSAGEMKDRVTRLEDRPAPPRRRPSLTWALGFGVAAAVCGMLAATASPGHFTGLYLGKDQERFLWFSTAVLVLLGAAQALRHAFPGSPAPTDPVKLRAELRLGADDAARFGPFRAAMSAFLLAGILSLVAWALESGGNAQGARWIWVGAGIGGLFGVIHLIRHAVERRRTDGPAEPTAASAWKVLATFIPLIALSIAFDRPGTSFLKLPLAIAAFAVILAANVIAILVLIRRKGRGSAWGIPAVTLFLALGLFPSSVGSSRPALVSSQRTGASGFANTSAGFQTVNDERLLDAVWPTIDLPRRVELGGEPAMGAVGFSAQRPNLLKARHLAVDGGKAEIFAVEFQTRGAREAEDWTGPVGKWSHRIQCPRVLMWIRSDDSVPGDFYRQQLLLAIEKRLW